MSETRISEFDLQDEIQNLSKGEEDDAMEEFDVDDASLRLEGCIELVATDSENILEEDVFQVYKSILANSSRVSSHMMHKLVDSLQSAILAEVADANRAIDADDNRGLAAHKMPMEMYAYLLQWFVSAAEKTQNKGSDPSSPVKTKARRGRGGKAGGGRSGKTAAAAAREEAETVSFVDVMPNFLKTLYKVLRFKIHRIWTTPTERDTFINCITRPAYVVAENEAYMKSKDLRGGFYDVISLAVKNHGHAPVAHTNFTQNLQFHEHLAEPLAECLHVMVKDHNYSQLADEILRTISNMSFSAQDSKSPRTVAKFLVRLTELLPRTVFKGMAMVLGQQDSEAYPMRMALLEVIGLIIKELSESVDLNMEQTQRESQAAALFTVLFDRMLDVSGYVRTKSLSVMVKLCSLETRYPKQRLEMTRAAIAALEDKVSTVRKNAVVLLAKLMETHPYVTLGGTLNLATWEDEYASVKEKLAEKAGSIGNVVDGDEEDDEEDAEEKEEGKAKEGSPSVKKEDAMDVDGEEEEEEATQEADDEEAQPRRKRKGQNSTLNLEALADEQQALAALDSTEVLQLRLQKKYTVEALKFVRQLEAASEIICQLLGSTHKAEVLESMEFFKEANRYNLEGAPKGIKQMMHLIWSKDNSATTEDGKELKGIRAKLLECYRTMYFEAVHGIEGNAQVNRITRNMIELTYDASLAELTSLEEMMKTMMDDGAIHIDIINRLWAVYSSDKQLPKRQRRGAIIVLGMLALSNRSVVKDKVDTLLKTGLGTFGKADLMLARYTCIALQRLNGSAKKIKGSLEDNVIRLEMNNVIFQRLKEVINEPCRSKDWFGLAEQVINTVYGLGDHPDEFCSEIIKTMTKKVFSPAKKTSETQPDETQGEPMDQDDPPTQDGMQQTSPSVGTTASTATKSKDVTDAFELSQLVFVVGHVAIKQIVFLEIIERELKRQKDVALAAEKAQTAPGARGASKDADELEQVVGNAEDEIGDRIQAVRETELLYGQDSLLAVYGPLIIHICGSPHKFKNVVLRAAATLALSKFLCVSPQFCEANHHLLFRILETSKLPNIRSNIVIALGDVAVSFSAIIDENSNELYKGLTDSNMVVKKNTLMVLTHLILNGMIKVKGQLGEMAKCVEDPDRRISDLAKLFFTELATKDNVIYNNLPDVISHLSTGEHAVEEEMFQNILKYIFKFIEKEKQAENIVDKLCQRFRNSEEPRQWRDIAFCLSLLPYKSERSVRKLIDGLTYYQDKLHEEGVFARFTEILTKARANKSKDKPDTELDEFEGILENHKQQGEDDKALEKRAQNKKAAVKKRATRRTTRNKSARSSGGGAAEPEPQADMYDSD